MVRIFCEMIGFTVVDTESLIMIAKDKGIEDESDLIQLAKSLFPSYTYPDMSREPEEMKPLVAKEKNSQIKKS